MTDPLRSPRARRGRRGRLCSCVSTKKVSRYSLVLRRNAAYSIFTSGSRAFVSIGLRLSAPGTPLSVQQVDAAFQSILPRTYVCVSLVPRYKLTGAPRLSLLSPTTSLSVLSLSQPLHIFVQYLPVMSPNDAVCAFHCS